MAKQVINVGTETNDGTGDSLRIAGFKINQNFDELYSALTSGINTILPGEGVDIVNSFGQVTITNLLPNRGTFKTISISGQGNIVADQLDDTLTLVAGNNVTLTTNPTNDSITISVDAINIDTFEGDFIGTFTGTVTGNVIGNVTGNVTGDVISTDIDTSLLKISGNAGEALAYYQGLLEQQDTLENDIIQIENLLDDLNQDLTDTQASLNILLAQPSPDPVAVQALQDEIASLELQIGSNELLLSTKQGLLSDTNANIAVIQPTLETPYAALTYNTVSLMVHSTQELSAPKLTVGDLHYPYEDGTSGQVISTDGAGNLIWQTISGVNLGDLSITGNVIYNAESPNQSILISPGNGTTSYIQVPGNTESATIPLRVINSGNGGISLLSNKISYQGDVTQSYQDNTECLAGVDTVIYTATASLQHSIKLFVMVEGLEAENVSGPWETQACDIVVVKGYNNNIVHISAYGLIYSGTVELATFDGRWNSTSNRIEIICRPTSLTNSVTASVHAIELKSND